MKEPSKSTRTERLTLRISTELLDRIKRKARESDLSVSSFVRMVLHKETK